MRSRTRIRSMPLLLQRAMRDGMGIGSEPAPVDHVSILVDRAITAPNISQVKHRRSFRLGNLCSELLR